MCLSREGLTLTSSRLCLRKSTWQPGKGRSGGLEGREDWAVCGPDAGRAVKEQRRGLM